MKATHVTLAALIALVLAGCGSKEEPTPATPPSTTTTGATGNKQESPPSATDVPDFSSDATVASNVIPMLNDKFAAEPSLAGTTLKIELKSKTLHIMGDVKSNDQKRKIDEIVKTIEAPAKAAGYSFMNMAVVKG